MYKKFYFIVFLAFITSGVVNGQANLLNSNNVDQIGKKTKEQLVADNDSPLPYGYIDDRDILWSKVVWEIVDLNQKINLPILNQPQYNLLSYCKNKLLKQKSALKIRTLFIMY